MSIAPLVDPMMVRRFVPHGLMDFFGGVLVMDGFDVEDVGIANARYPNDEDVVDCSQRIFQVTNYMIMVPQRPLEYAVFPIRRWRNLVADIAAVPLHAIAAPTKDEPLLYIGNPIRLTADHQAIHVGRLPEFTVKSGIELGY